MNLFNRGPKKLPQNSERLLVNPDEMPAPQTIADYLRRGYAYYARSKFSQAEEDFRAAIARDAKAVDALYALGMTLKAQQRKEEAIKTFQQTIALIEGGAVENKNRAQMLRRLALGHINEMDTGDWNLEKEIWHRID